MNRKHILVDDGKSPMWCTDCGRSGDALTDNLGICPGAIASSWPAPGITFSDSPPSKSKTPATILREGADQFAAKDGIYGSSYKSVGKLMESLFPKGLTIKTVADWNRLCILVQVVGKFHRYAANLMDGGHEDSAHDMMVYSAMLKEVTSEGSNREIRGADGSVVGSAQFMDADEARAHIQK